MSLTMTVLAGTYDIHRFEPDRDIPPAVFAEPLFAVLRSGDELSIVCASSLELASDAVQRHYRCFKVKGPLDFSLTGVISRIASVLAEREIPVFTISSYDTDYVLVASTHFAAAIEAFETAEIAIAKEPES